jgi:hypothetical protein
MARQFVERSAGPFSLCPDHGDGVVVMSQDVVDLDPLRPARQFENPSEKLLHLRMALVPPV